MEKKRQIKIIFPSPMIMQQFIKKMKHEHLTGIIYYTVRHLFFVHFTRNSVSVMAS